MDIRVSILTISDRSYQGIREDKSGQALAEEIRRQGWTIVDQKIVPDDREKIGSCLIKWSDSQVVDLILTTGGTGVSPRDVTPEATTAVIERLIPGIAEAMRISGLKSTPNAMLSRSVAGIRGKTLIVNLPGSPAGALESLKVILPVIPHAVELIQGEIVEEHKHYEARK